LKIEVQKVAKVLVPLSQRLQLISEIVLALFAITTKLVKLKSKNCILEQRPVVENPFEDGPMQQFRWILFECLLVYIKGCNSTFLTFVANAQGILEPCILLYTTELTTSMPKPTRKSSEDFYNYV
jgi:hypothetical protein